MKLGVLITITILTLIAIFSGDACANTADSTYQKADVIEKADSSVADTSYSGRIKKYELKNISDKAGTFELNIKLPSNMKFNPAAPFVIKVSSDKPDIIEIGEYDITRSARKIKLPIKVKRGEATLIIDLSFSYCYIVNTTLCYFEDVRLEIPAVITEDGGDKSPVRYEVFE